jgi:Tol biopolymer transport system component
VAIERGQQLLHYRLIEQIGEGGMGVVWKALDTTLDREVAIKVLPATLSDDSDRLARLEREAKLLASLNHPNVATVHGLHHEGDIRFVAMELVDGEDLSQRLERGPIPVDEAIEIARQIAEGLEAAHAAGVIHRDLKPANIRLSTDRRVKVLDFGLARALSHGPASSDASPTLLPTVTSSGTEVGTILGTAAYMSPEQARGRAADSRADVWAFGVVLYEMLSGRFAFKSDTVSDTLASVLKVEPDLDTLPSRLPRRIRHLLMRCLQKDRRKRLHHIADARIVLEETLAGLPDEDAAEAIARAASRTTERLLWVAALAVVAVVAAMVTWSLLPALAERPHRRILLALDDEDRGDPGLTNAKISPDGRRILYEDGPKTFVHDLKTGDSLEIAAAEGAGRVFWSHDGESIGYELDKALWRVSADGSGRALISELDWSVNGAAWGPDGRILISVEDAEDGGLYEVSDRGGEPTLLPIAEPENGHFHNVDLLPGGRGVLVTVHQRPVMGVAVVAEGELTTLIEMETRYLPKAVYSPTGHVLYTRGGNNEGIWALPFSIDRLEPTGEPFVVVADGIGPSVSSDETLVYRQFEFDPPVQLVWVDREGTTLGTIGQAGDGFDHPSLSPDGERIVVRVGLEPYDLWIVSVTRGTQTRLTAEEGSEIDPVWTPDGNRVVYRWLPEEGAPTIMIRNADGSDAPEILTEGNAFSLSPDGRHLIFSRSGEETGADLWTMELGGDAEPISLLQTASAESGARVSPDGNYLAYHSNESGRYEIYVRRFPSGDGKWLASIDGGTRPRWSPKGDELFWIDNGDLMAAEVQTGTDLTLGTPRRLFTWRPSALLSGGEFDMTADAQRFVLVAREERPDSTQSATLTVMMVENWLGE